MPQTSWNTGYDEKIIFVAPFLSGLLRCLIGLMLKGGHKYVKIGLNMGVKIGGGAEKVGKNTNLLVIMRTRLSQKIGLHNFTNRNRFKKVNS